MAENYVGQLQMFGGDYEVAGWARCDGQILEVKTNKALFDAIGTKFGGDGTKTFGLPDLRGRIPIGAGRGKIETEYKLGTIGGTESVELNMETIAAHTHRAMGSSQGGQNSPSGNYWGTSQGTIKPYAKTTGTTPMHRDSIMDSDGGQRPHDNVMPFVAVSFLVALDGEPPSAPMRNIGPILGEIRGFLFDTVPEGWTPCDGREMHIADNQALYAIVGSTFGGDDRVVFNLPDLRGRVPMHADAANPIGDAGGTEWQTLTEANLPRHSHRVLSSTTGFAARLPEGKAWRVSNTQRQFFTTVDVPLAPTAISTEGGGRPHPNMQPFGVIQFLMATRGIFPRRP